MKALFKAPDPPSNPLPEEMLINAFFQQNTAAEYALQTALALVTTKAARDLGLHQERNRTNPTVLQELGEIVTTALRKHFVFETTQLSTEVLSIDYLTFRPLSDKAFSVHIQEQESVVGSAIYCTEHVTFEGPDDKRTHNIRINYKFTLDPLI